MRYFVGYVIGGTAAAWHRALVAMLAGQFGTRRLDTKVPAHITLVPPFETEDIESARNVVRAWAAELPSGHSFRISGFGTFNDSVVFADVEADTLVRDAVMALRNRLGKLVPHCASEQTYPWHPHITLADQLTPKTIVPVLEYVQALPIPRFTLPLNAVAVLRKENGAWIEDCSFPIPWHGGV